ncbi:ArsC family reductase [Alteraurantiacibacter aquimixticola]|uniref:ArsC family reductase n=1 Tax=Alteraurantiacibacter aquimixticola TaxID=2489173 RepID=A0A4T3EWB2_9SPHN|nr:ArsC family reductase [Alteraurantiacibacter aquimixticola]TIX48835.1 ArsC family reductase [Alteraurantiacibacter aquimixticola]
MIQFYGIPNCDTVKKARKWLESQGLDYSFHDYKKEGADAEKLARWSDEAGWEVLLNRRGTTFRKLPDADKEGIDRDKAIALMVEHPSMIKRPVVELPDSTRILVGFAQSEWENALT